MLTQDEVFIYFIYFLNSRNLVFFEKCIKVCSFFLQNPMKQNTKNIFMRILFVCLFCLLMLYVIEVNHLSGLELHCVMYIVFHGIDLGLCKHMFLTGNA